jgi:sugar lactone lactonase YvrE
MNRLFRLTLGLLLALSLTACGSSDSTDETETGGNGDTSTQDVVDDSSSMPSDGTEPDEETTSNGGGCRSVESQSVEKEVTSIGASSNQIVKDGDFLWIVESGDNVVSRYNLETDSYTSGFIDVGSGRNPYSIAIAKEARRVYITNFASDSITVADYDTGDVVQEIEAESLASPSGIALTESSIYVTNINLDGREYGDGSVTVLKRSDFSTAGTLNTAQKNPQFVETVKINGNNTVIVAETGVISFGEGGSVSGVSEGAIEIWTEPSGDGQLEKTTLTIENLESNPTLGGPGRIAITPDKSSAYVASGTAPVLFKVDLADKELERGVDNPIQMYETEGSSLDSIDIADNGILALTAFNKDALYLYDTDCDEKIAGPIDLATSSQLEGAQDISIFPTDNGYEGYFLMGLASRMGKATFSFTGESQ